ncbi:major facilitator superfamily domain-containing protein [Apiospora aurea]|uniref:Major facilitator superfamily domain-containing protein n=1 Tax=Apiospora aurea TaxID=335848 RepID=A0ABR1PTZ4_9PEZI
MAINTTAKDHRRVQAAAERALTDQTNLLSRPRLLTVFAVLSLSLLISFIDQNGIGVTLPTIAADLDAGDTISWAGTASLIANTTFAMLYGRLSDVFGRKAVFLVAVALLSVAALLCGFAQDAAVYVFRALAGIGGGGVSNLAMIIVSDIVTLERRGKYQGFIGSCVGLGNITGPFLAAAFISSPRTTWRAFFWTTAPLAALMGGVGWFLIPGIPPSASPQQQEQQEQQSKAKICEGLRRIDWAGVATSSIAVVFLLIPISGGGAYFPWDSPMVISMLVIGVLSLGLFIFVESRVARLPMMPLEIFQNPVISIMLAQSFLFGAVYQSYLYYLPMYLQNARRYSVLASAAFTAALVAMQSIFSVAGGQYIARTKRYGEVIWFGFGSWTLGSCLTLLYAATTPTGLIILPLLLIGAGVGCIFQPTLVAFQAHMTKPKRAVIIANRNFFRCGGGACGLAVSGAVLQAALRANLPASHLCGTGGSPPALGRRRGGALLIQAYVAASRAVFILQIPLIGLCLLGCAFIRDRGLQPLKDDSGGDDEVKEDFDTSVDELRQQQPLEEKTGSGNPVEDNNRGA